MELPEKLKEKLIRARAQEEKIQRKIKSTLEYKRRKIDKDVKRHTKGNRVIKFREIDRIGRHYGFYTEGTPFREDRSPHENVKVLPKRGA